MSKLTKIGYCNPPEHTQFQKGQSGNPSGRPRGRRAVGDILLDEFFRTMPVQEYGRSTRMPVIKAVIRGLLAKAGKGDPRAFNALMRQVPTAQSAQLGKFNVDDYDEIIVEVNMGDEERQARVAARLDEQEEQRQRLARAADVSDKD